LIAQNVAIFAGAAVGQDSGTSITLDATTAGNGWYINTNPAVKPATEACRP